MFFLVFPRFRIPEGSSPGNSPDGSAPGRIVSGSSQHGSAPGQMGPGSSAHSSVPGPPSLLALFLAVRQGALSPVAGHTLPGCRACLPWQQCTGAHLTQQQGAWQCARAHCPWQQGTPSLAAVRRGAPSQQQGTGVHNVLAQMGLKYPHK